MFGGCELVACLPAPLWVTFAHALAGCAAILGPRGVHACSLVATEGPFTKRAEFLVSLAPHLQDSCVAYSAPSIEDRDNNSRKLLARWTSIFF